MKKTLLPLLLALLVVGCSALTGDQNELVICSSLPLNGGRDARAVSMSNAIQQAIDETGTITVGSQPYNLRYVAMDGTTPERGSWDTGQEARNARAAISEHDCIAYIGTYNSGAAKISMPILNRVQMAMISPGNTYPGLTKPGTGIGDEPWIYSPLGPDRRNYCRVVPGDDLQAPAAARFAAEELGVERVFIIHDTELYGQGLADIFAEAAAELGMEVLAEPMGVDFRTVPPDSVARAILPEAPDLVYFGGVTGNGPGEILGALRERGYEGYFMGADGIAEADFIERAGAFGDDRVYATLVGLPPEQLQEAGLNWANRYRQQYGSPPDAFAAPSYEAALVVIDAIQRATLPDRSDPNFLEEARPAVLSALKATQNFDGILGAWSFDENCDTTNTTISMNQAEGDSFVFRGVVTGD